MGLLALAVSDGDDGPEVGVYHPASDGAAYRAGMGAGLECINRFLYQIDLIYVDGQINKVAFREGSFTNHGYSFPTTQHMERAGLLRATEG